MTGQEFIELQKSCGMTNVKMAESMGVSERQITYLRNAKGDIEKLYEMAAFGVIGRFTGAIVLPGE